MGVQSYGSSHINILYPYLSKKLNFFSNRISNPYESAILSFFYGAVPNFQFFVKIKSLKLQGVLTAHRIIKTELNNLNKLYITIIQFI